MSDQAVLEIDAPSGPATVELTDGTSVVEMALGQTGTVAIATDLGQQGSVGPQGPKGADGTAVVPSVLDGGNF